MNRRVCLGAAQFQVGVFASSRRFVHPSQMEAPLDRQIGNKTNKGPPVAHQLNVYKKVHKLHAGAKWKKANLMTNQVGGKDLRIRDTHGEGRVDEQGMYRDWVYGTERRYANMLSMLLFGTSVSLFYYTIRILRSDKWDMPAPLLMKPEIIKK